MLSNDVEKADPQNLDLDKLVKQPETVDEYPPGGKRCGSKPQFESGRGLWTTPKCLIQGYRQGESSEAVNVSPDRME